MRVFATVFATLIVLTTAGCSVEEDGHGASTQRDSAGVSIVHNSGNPPAHRLEVLRPPHIAIGGDPADSEPLFQVRGFARLSDGRIRILNAGSHEVRTYLPDGRLRIVAGRRGAGPKEMQIPVMMVTLPADTSFILDIGAKRFTVVGPEDSIIGVRLVRHRLSGIIDLLGSGTAVLSEPSYTMGNGERLVPMQSVVRLVNLESGKADTIATIGGRQEYQYQIGERLFRIPVPFTVHPVARVAREHEVYVIDGVSPEIRVYSLGAELKRIIRVDYAPQRISSNEFDSAAEWELSQLAPEHRPTVQRLYNQMPRPHARPYFDDLREGPDGRMWVRRYVPPNVERQEWLEIDSTGHIISALTAPAKVAFRQVSRDYAIGLYVDSLGVETVGVFSVYMVSKRGLSSSAVR
jgi:hypothetical protein